VSIEPHVHPENKDLLEAVGAMQDALVSASNAISTLAKALKVSNKMASNLDARIIVLEQSGRFIDTGGDVI
jgi:hypothetical protein